MIGTGRLAEAPEGPNKNKSQHVRRLKVEGAVGSRICAGFVRCGECGAEKGEKQCVTHDVTQGECCLPRVNVEPRRLWGFRGFTWLEGCSGLAGRPSSLQGWARVLVTSKGENTVSLHWVQLGLKSMKGFPGHRTAGDPIGSRKIGNGFSGFSAAGDPKHGSKGEGEAWYSRSVGTEGTTR